MTAYFSNQANSSHPTITARRAQGSGADPYPYYTWRAGEEFVDPSIKKLQSFPKDVIQLVFGEMADHHIESRAQQSVERMIMRARQRTAGKSGGVRHHALLRARAKGRARMRWSKLTSISAGVAIDLLPAVYTLVIDGKPQEALDEATESAIGMIAGAVLKAAGVGAGAAAALTFLLVPNTSIPDPAKHYQMVLQQVQLLRDSLVAQHRGYTFVVRAGEYEAALGMETNIRVMKRQMLDLLHQLDGLLLEASAGRDPSRYRAEKAALDRFQIIAWTALLLPDTLSRE